MVLDNDTRGWIMAIVSGIACTVGASIICVDLIICQLPGKKNFKIENSNYFLSAGTSLSFGVMIFSSLYSILPQSKKYLQNAGLSPKNAALTLICCFLIGALAISVISRILHHYIPHSVVDCDHDHDDTDDEDEDGKAADLESGKMIRKSSQNSISGQWNLSEPGPDPSDLPSHGTTPSSSDILRRPTLQASISTKVTQLVTGSKQFCDEDGQCFGYSDPCGQECFRNIHARLPRVSTFPTRLTTKPSVSRTQTLPQERQPLLANVEATSPSPLQPTISGPGAVEHPAASNGHGHSHPAHSHHHHPSLAKQTSRPSIKTIASTSSLHSLSHTHSHAHSHHSHHSHHGGGHQHHHHVPTNAFLSIGLQTSIAIALHKVPEGFITYATNHANPTLGFSIFLALFIHNITEGFALALPLYLAIKSRWRAMFWSALLGGISQPLGAGVAALWFGLAGRKGEDGDGGKGEGEGDDAVYGAMFALTAGIMAMVSLQLFGESLDLTHSRRVCFASAFAGMGILGLSGALTA